MFHLNPSQPIYSQLGSVQAELQYMLERCYLHVRNTVPDSWIGEIVPEIQHLDKMINLEFNVLNSKEISDLLPEQQNNLFYRQNTLVSNLQQIKSCVYSPFSFMSTWDSLTELQPLLQNESIELTHSTAVASPPSVSSAAAVAASPPSVSSAAVAAAVVPPPSVLTAGAIPSRPTVSSFTAASVAAAAAANYSRPNCNSTATAQASQKDFCNVCRKPFNKSYLLKHFRDNHKGNLPVSCPVCGLGFFNNDQVSNHRSHVDPKNRCFQTREKKS